MAKTKLGKRSAKLLHEFDEAAQSHGWEQDQGYGGSAERAKLRHAEALKALERHIARLEQKAQGSAK